jgi:hypothetical protein
MLSRNLPTGQEMDCGRLASFSLCLILSAEILCKVIELERLGILDQIPVRASCCVNFVLPGLHLDLLE